MTATPREGSWSRRVSSPETLLVALPTFLIATVAIRGIYAKVWHAGATLDDAYIHFQYARAIAELHPFRYQAGEPLTTGGTSVLWPLLLAPFYAVGFRGSAILWPAWAMAFTCLGLLAREVRLLTRPLAGPAASAGAAAMVLAFSGLSWSAASGMEVVPFAWLLARGARRCSEWMEQEPLLPRDSRAISARRLELLGLAAIVPLFRPEGVLVSLMVAVALGVRPRPAGSRGRLLALLALVEASLPILISFCLTGQLRSNTAVAKLLPGNPYMTGEALFAAVATNVRILLGTLLDGRLWSAEFLPRGGAAIALAGLVAVAVRGWQARTPWRASFVIALGLGMTIPCAYVSFLWNRLRYLWPFASGWLVGLACLSRVMGDAAARVRARWRLATPLLCGAFAGALVVHQGWALEDVADSANGINRQHVTLGLWARDHLPARARIGVNDTGAIAYFSDRHTFDVVGLTTADEARYWVAGPASRFEHYERMRRARPDALPTHFIVYPEWMACDAVLGQTLFEVTVPDATILGGATMRVYEADYTKLGSGDEPWTAMGPRVDTLDVADLESEAEHHYELGDARDGEEDVHVASAPDGRTVADGGRASRRVERFRARTGETPSRGIVRLAASLPTKVLVLSDGGVVGSFEADAGDWEEDSFDLPAGPATRNLELRPENGVLATYHYWFESLPGR